MLIMGQETPAETRNDDYECSQSCEHRCVLSSLSHRVRDETRRQSASETQRTLVYARVAAIIMTIYTRT